MPVTQYVDDLLIDPQYFAEITQALSKGQEVRNLLQAPEINWTHLLLFAMSLAPIFYELRENSPTTSVPEPMDLLTLICFCYTFLGMSSARSFSKVFEFFLLVYFFLCVSRTLALFTAVLMVCFNDLSWYFFSKTGDSDFSLSFPVLILIVSSLYSYSLTIHPNTRACAKKKKQLHAIELPKMGMGTGENFLPLPGPIWSFSTST